MALGIFFSGSSDSPAAVPINSTPWKEKPAIIKIAKIEENPPTNGASSIVQLWNPGDSVPTPRINKDPNNKNTITVITLMLENRYSLSPKERADK